MKNLINFKAVMIQRRKILPSSLLCKEMQITQQVHNNDGSKISLSITLCTKDFYMQKVTLAMILIVILLNFSLTQFERRLRTVILLKLTLSG